jgi:hypothetical protein
MIWAKHDEWKEVRHHEDHQQQTEHNVERRPRRKEEDVKLKKKTNDGE